MKNHMLARLKLGHLEMLKKWFRNIYTTPGNKNNSMATTGNNLGNSQESDTNKLGGNSIDSSNDNSREQLSPPQNGSEDGNGGGICGLLRRRGSKHGNSFRRHKKMTSERGDPEGYSSVSNPSWILDYTETEAPNAKKLNSKPGSFQKHQQHRKRSSNCEEESGSRQGGCESGYGTMCGTEDGPLRGGSDCEATTCNCPNNWYGDPQHLTCNNHNNHHHHPSSNHQHTKSTCTTSHHYSDHNSSIHHCNSSNSQNSSQYRKDMECIQNLGMNNSSSTNNSSNTNSSNTNNSNTINCSNINTSDNSSHDQYISGYTEQQGSSRWLLEVNSTLRGGDHLHDTSAWNASDRRFRPRLSELSEGGIYLGS